MKCWKNLQGNIIEAQAYKSVLLRYSFLTEGNSYATIQSCFRMVE